MSYLRSHRGWFDTSSLSLESAGAWTLRDLLPRGRLGDLAVRAPGDRYLGLRSALRGADIVHAQELGYWYSKQAARLRSGSGFKLVLTVWETIPLLDAYRNVRTRAYRRETLRATDLFLAATERARESLLLEGAPPERIRVLPAWNRDRPVRRRRWRRRGHDDPLARPPGLEKGHQDVLRAVALLRREADPPPRRLACASPARDPTKRACAHTPPNWESRDAVEFRGFVSYDEMPSLYAGAACVVLASLPVWSWEEQFGMVLAEAMAAGRPIVASSSGAIPEVAGACAEYFAPGDWLTLARHLARMLRSGDDGQTTASAAERARVFSTQAAAARIADAYAELLAGP